VGLLFFNFQVVSGNHAPFYTGRAARQPGRNIRPRVRVLLTERSVKGANVTRFLSVLSAAVLLAEAGCYMPAPKVRKTVTTSDKVEIGGAESTSVSIAVGVGKLNITGGAEGLLDAEFEYNIPDWKPEVRYEVKEGFGELEIEQPATVVGATWPSNVKYEWNLKLSDSMPMDLTVEMGVGKLDLDLRGLNLRRLKVDAGVGEGRVDISRVVRDLDADIEAGIGKLKLLLPADVGVKVEADGGIGHVEVDGLTRDGDAWVNDLWGKAGISVRVNIEGGIGEVDIETVPAQSI
jgi:hypothetical protein